MKKWFSKWWRRELAPALTEWDRRTLATPSTGIPGVANPSLEAAERDAMVQTALSVKRLGVLAAPTRVVPASDSPSARRKAAFVEEAFARMHGSPQTVLDAAMDAFIRGWSVQELVFEADPKGIWLTAIRPKDPAQFGLQMDAYGQIQELRMELPDRGPQTLPKAKFVIYRYRVDYRNPKGRGDLAVAAGHVIAKNELMAAWKLHLERFASPTMLGAFGAGVSAADRQAVLSALNEMARVNAIVHPQEIAVSKIGGDREASSGYIDAIDFHNREIARSILGQTLTTDEGRRMGSLALGKVHLQVFLLQLTSLRRELADTVISEQVIRPLVELNFGPGDLPRFEFESAPLEAFTGGML